MAFLLFGKFQHKIPNAFGSLLSPAAGMVPGMWKVLTRYCRLEVWVSDLGFLLYDLIFMGK